MSFEKCPGWEQEKGLETLLSMGTVTVTGDYPGLQLEPVRKSKARYY